MTLHLLSSRGQKVYNKLATSHTVTYNNNIYTDLHKQKVVRPICRAVGKTW